VEFLSGIDSETERRGMIALAQIIVLVVCFRALAKQRRWHP
jgi:hypothetical protein